MRGRFSNTLDFFAKPTDPKKLRYPLAERVDSFSTPGAVFGHFSASQNGVLMYTSGAIVGNSQLVFGKAGHKEGVLEVTTLNTLSRP
jgi:hypothetical protein